MITPISTNEYRTVGLCEGTTEEMIYVGKFKASLLKEFAERILSDLGDVQIYLHTKELKAPEGTFHLIAAFDEIDSDLLVGASSCVDDFTEKKKDGK